MTNLLITGGLGHIGSYLLRDDRLEKFDRVRVVDNFMTQRYASVFELPKNIELVEADMRYDDTHHMIKDMDVVLHLAATVNAAETVDKNDETKLNNYTATCRLVDALCRDGKGKHLVFLSTTSVYGPSENTRAEDCNEYYPQSPYAEHKLRAEEYIWKNYRAVGHPATILRCGTIFGYSMGMRFHTVTNKFIWNAVNRCPITIWEPGTGKRPYLSLQHASDAIFNSITNKLGGPGDTFNVVTKHWNPLEIVDHIKKYIDPVHVSMVKPPILNQASYIVACNKAMMTHLYNTHDEIASKQLSQYINLMVNKVLKGLI